MIITEALITCAEVDHLSNLSYAGASRPRVEERGRPGLLRTARRTGEA